MDNAGFLSFATFAWVMPTMWAIFRRKLDTDTLTLSPLDEADMSTKRSTAAAPPRTPRCPPV